MSQPNDDAIRKFPGFRKPNYTMVPDELFDELMPELTGAELKVLLYVIRRTFGFKKGSDRISKSQLESGIQRSDGSVLDNGTGLSRRAIRLAIDGLVNKNVLLKCSHDSEEKGHETTEYALNVSNSDADLPPWVKSTQGAGVKSTQALGYFLPPQETVKQQTDVVVIGDLQRSGITQSIAKRLVKLFPPDLIRAKIELVDYLVDTDSPLVKRNPAGYLRRAIEQDYEPPAGFMTRAERDAQAAEQERIEAEREEHREQHDAAAQAMACYCTTAEVSGIWQQVQEQLRITMPESTYSTYFRNAVLLSLDDGTATLAFPTAQTRDWATNRLAQSLHRAFEQVIGREVSVDAMLISGVGQGNTDR